MLVAPLRILSQSENWIAIDKPSGLASIPGRDHPDSALNRVAEQLRLPSSGQIDPRVRVVHRLDKDTSGVLLFALNVTTQRHLSHQFQNNQVEKEYLALVAGRPEQDAGEINAPIGPHPSAAKRMAVLKHGGRPARTLWKLEERFKAYSLLRVLPKTGKTHQIRVHLKSIGLPLAIDPVYNPQPPSVSPGVFLSQFKRNYRATKGEAERPLIGRLTLHAHRLRFMDLDGAAQTVEAELPRDFLAVRNQLRRYSAFR